MELREEIERAGVDDHYKIPAGMTKQVYLEMRLSDAIAEEDKYDLLVMGRTQGQGLEFLGIVPQDDEVYRFDCDGKPIIQLSEDSPVRKALEEIVKKLEL